MKILFFLAPLFIPKTSLKNCLKRQLEILLDFKVLNQLTEIFLLNLHSINKLTNINSIKITNHEKFI